ncbi:MAG TPA: hypothetical protein VMT62_09125 [Syntrophorhabdaceae bacterium]|nr:hypothetical protein [Syntrophorhabdaceae bacterium]
MEKSISLTRILVAVFVSVILAGVFARRALAVRPFVTDDARILDEHTMQLEASVRYDKDVFTNLNLVAMSPVKKSEITMGFVDGFPLDVESNRSFSITGPLIQYKYLLWEAKPNGYPGMAFATGASPPWGRGDLRPNRWSEFLYLAATESLFDKERVLIHGNIGISTTNPATVATWGVGTQIRMIGGLNGVFEVFYNDPYAGKTGGAFQAGFRYIVSDKIQIDMTTGSGLFGSEQLNTFVGMGLRLVSDKLW